MRGRSLIVLAFLLASVASFRGDGGGGFPSIYRALHMGFYPYDRGSGVCRCRENEPYYRALLFFQRGDLSSAEKELQKVLRDPSSHYLSRARAKLCEIYLWKRDYSAALEVIAGEELFSEWREQIRGWKPFDGTELPISQVDSVEGTVDVGGVKAEFSIVREGKGWKLSWKNGALEGVERFGTDGKVRFEPSLYGRRGRRKRSSWDGRYGPGLLNLFLSGFLPVEGDSIVFGEGKFQELRVVRGVIGVWCYEVERKGDVLVVSLTCSEQRLRVRTEVRIKNDQE